MTKGVKPSPSTESALLIANSASGSGRSQSSLRPLAKATLCLALLGSLSYDKNYIDTEVLSRLPADVLPQIQHCQFDQTAMYEPRFDENGLLKKINLIIATGQNNLAMNRTVAQIARHYVRGKEIPEPMLNRVEAGIRCFNPCLSCSTHAMGQMPMEVELLDADGSVLDRVERE